MPFFSDTDIMRQAPKKPKSSSLLTRNDDKTGSKSKTPTLSRFRKLRPHQHTPSRNRTATTRCNDPLLAATDVPWAILRYRKSQREKGLPMLNENIRELRKQKGLSQEELAIKLNVVRQTVSKWNAVSRCPTRRCSFP